MKKLAELPGYWLDLAQIWCRGYFWILNPKSTTYDVILTSKWRKRKNTYISLAENTYDVILTSLLSSSFENLNLSSYYEGPSPHQIWVNLSQGKQSYGGGGGGAADSAPPQVENIFNHPGEIGLIWS